MIKLSFKYKLATNDPYFWDNHTLNVRIKYDFHLNPYAYFINMHVARMNDLWVINND